jgi:chromosomal replication initiator protein
LALLWDAVLAQLDAPVRALLAACRPVGLDDHQLRLLVPDEFTRQRIEQRLQGRLGELASDRAGQAIRLQVTVDPSLHQARPSQLAAAEPWAIGPAPGDGPEADPAPSGGARGGAAGPASQGGDDSLNRKYVFDTFVIGPSNRFAHAAATAVAEAAVEKGPGNTYNPLFIYGDSGLGKTHLLHAIGNYVTTNSTALRLKYVSTEELTNDFINAISENRIAEFRRVYRQVDVLLIDDIQFLESKAGTQEEFFHTFDALYNAQKQIVMTSDRPPHLFKEIAPRLRSRFEGGLLVDVHPADLETRSAILRKKAMADGLTLDPEVLSFIATRIQSNIRELEGALTRLTAFASLNGLEINLDMAEIILPELVAADQGRPITTAMVIAETAARFDLTVDELRGPGRSANVALARQIAMYLSRELTDLSLPKIGTEFSRDHTTVMHACRKIRDLIAHDRGVFSTVTDITDRVRQRAQKV